MAGGGETYPSGLGEPGSGSVEAGSCLPSGELLGQRINLCEGCCNAFAPGGRTHGLARAGLRSAPTRGWRSSAGTKKRSDGARYGSPALAGIPGLDLAPAHGHGVDEVEQCFGKDGLGRAELLAAVLADEDGGEGAELYPETAPRGGGPFGAVLEEGFGQEVAVCGGGPVAL